MTEGLSVNALANKHAISWAAAKALKDELSDAVEPEDGPEPSPETGPPVFKIEITIPADRVIELVRGTDRDELLAAIEGMEAGFHADLLQAILQKKFDRILEPDRAIETPQIELVAAS